MGNAQAFFAWKAGFARGGGRCAEWPPLGWRGSRGLNMSEVRGSLALWNPPEASEVLEWEPTGGFLDVCLFFLGKLWANRKGHSGSPVDE